MEKRRSSRELLRAPGCIIVEGVEYPCEIHDRSVTGARLKDFRLTLPPEFMLRLIPQSSLAIRCWLIWQDGNEAGVSFIKPEQI